MKLAISINNLRRFAINKCICSKFRKPSGYFAIVIDPIAAIN